MEDYNTMLEGMEDGTKDKEILKAIGSDLKPYVKRNDGHAKVIESDIEVTYKDYDGHENVMKIPAGSVAMIMPNRCAEVITKDDFDKKYVFHDEGQEVAEEKKEPAHSKPEKPEKPVKKTPSKNSPMGIESM